MHRLICGILAFHFFLLQVGAEEIDYVLDFVEYPNELSTLTNAGIELVELKGLQYQRELPPGTYLLRIPRNNGYIIEVKKRCLSSLIQKSMVIYYLI